MLNSLRFIARRLRLTVPAILAAAWFAGLACAQDIPSSKPLWAPIGFMEPEAGANATICHAKPGRMFVSTPAGTECVAYYATDKGAGSRRLVISFSGDFANELLNVPDRAKSWLEVTHLTYEALAERHNAQYILVARVGTLGSSGVHVRDRRHQREGEAMNAMIDSLIAMTKAQDVALVGQSGGSYVVAAALSSGRKDIRCVAAGSGAYSLEGRWRSKDVPDEGIAKNFRTAPANNPWYSPLEESARVAKDAARRIFVIGDPQDKNTVFEEQHRYATTLAGLGHHVVLLPATGIGEERHGTSHISARVAGWCLNAATDRDIAAAIPQFKTWPRAITDPPAGLWQVGQKSLDVPIAPLMPRPATVKIVPPVVVNTSPISTPVSGAANAPAATPPASLPNLQ